MDSYDPDIGPDLDEWQTLDESEQINLVQDFHIEANEEIPEGGAMLHASIHVVVENQIAIGTEPVPATVKKLTRQGLTRHEAIHAVGAIICENLFDIVQGNDNQWNPKQYRRRLEKLTAKRWKKGQW
jgi:hypothetical protein